MKTDLKRLTDLSTYTKGSSSVRAALSRLQTDLARLRSQGGDQWRPQIDAVQQRLNGLGDALKGTTSGDLGSSLTRVRQAGDRLVAAGENLTTRIDRTCNGS